MKNKTKVSKDLKFKRNPRKITDAQLELLRSHLSELGDLSGVIYCHNNKAYVGGNQRSDVFDNSQIEITERFSEPTKQKTLAHGFIVWQGEKYAYREVAFTEQEFKKACIVANHDGGAWDMDILRTEFDIPELAEWGFEVPEFETVQIPQSEYQSFKEFQEQKKEVIDNTKNESKGTEPQVNKAKELNDKWQVKRGDLFQIGNHRLLCGDSTLPEDVLRLMEDEKADICFTSPPYHHDFDDKINDWFDMMDVVYHNIKKFCKCIIINVCMLSKNKKAIINFLSKYQDDFIDIAIWDKGHPTPVLKENVLSSNFEFIIFLGGNSSRSIPFGNFKGNIENIFRISRGKNSIADLHRAVFPIELPIYILSDICSLSESVFDPFCGSGTTMVAAENLNRRCFGMEISPDYCAVVLERIKTAYPEIEISLCPHP